MSFLADDYNRTIDLYPDPVGNYSADWNRPAPVSAPIVPYTPTPQPRYVPPAPVAAPVSSSPREWSQQDYDDFGFNDNGTPSVVRDPRTGRATWNSDNDLSRESYDAINNGINRSPRSANGRQTAGRVLERIGRAIDLFDAFSATSEASAAASNYLFSGGDPTRNPYRSRAWGPFGGIERNPDYMPPGSPSGEVRTPEGGEQLQGQCDVDYFVDNRIRGTVNGQPYDTGPMSTTSGQGIGKGPFSGAYIRPNQFGIPTVYINGPSGQPISIAGLGGIDNASVELRFNRADGSNVQCGQRQPGNEPATSSPTRPDYPPDYAPFPQPFPQPQGNPLRNPIDNPNSPFPWPNLPNLPFPDIPNLPLNGPGGSSSPGPLPQPQPTGQGDRPTPPRQTDEDNCCAGQGLALDEVLRQLRNIRDSLSTGGTGQLALVPCGYDGDNPEQFTEEFAGQGLQGIYDGIGLLLKGTQPVFDNTKCPPDSAGLALPMFYEVKHGEIPQLVVIWRKTEGGGSTWSMTIPHPRSNIGADYPFDFPTYTKGGNMASIRLTDNSQVIINAFSEAEAQRVFDYLESLIDPAFIPSGGFRMVYSKNVADYAQVTVTASYVKRFQGHKTTTPLWTKRIPE